MTRREGWGCRKEVGDTVHGPNCSPWMYGRVVWADESYCKVEWPDGGLWVGPHGCVFLAPRDIA